jgi:hypothetical protein
MSLTEILDSANTMEPKKFEKLFRKLSAIRMKKNAIPMVRTLETNLIRRINSEFEQKKWDRLKYLDWKSEESALTSQEQSESLRLAEEYERFSTERLKSLTKLAALRQVSIGELMNQFGIS